MKKQNVLSEAVVNVVDLKNNNMEEKAINQELEDAGLKWFKNRMMSGKGVLTTMEIFKAGANWQKEQSATDAVEMLQWLVEQDNAVLLYEGLIQHKASAKELSKQLYKLWHTNQKKSTMY